MAVSHSHFRVRSSAISASIAILQCSLVRSQQYLEKARGRVQHLSILLQSLCLNVPPLLPPIHPPTISPATTMYNSVQLPSELQS